MKSRLVRIGNSRGVRLPEALIEEAGLQDEVEIRAEGRSIVITPGSRPREGWAAAARRLAEDGADGLLDEPTETRFDRDEWKWCLSASDSARPPVVGSRPQEFRSC